MTDIGPTQFTREQYLAFADEIEKRAVAFAQATGKREAILMAHMTAATIRNLAPGGLAER